MNEGRATSRRILLVEDDAELRDALSDALGERGHDVIPVEDGRVALDVMRERHPDVVVLDLMMPVLDGWQFRVEQRNDPTLAETPVVAISASHSSAAAAVDADRFLPKPCSATKILEAIEEVLAVRERRAQPARAAQQERMAALGTLAAGIAHEINNPLTYILLHLGNAVRLIENAHEVRDRARLDQLGTLVKSAIDGAERIREITRGVRTFSRAGLEHARAPLDLREPLGAALRMIDNELRHRARLVQIDGEVPYVNADEGRLAQVFLNLLGNAVQAIPEGDATQHQIKVVTGTAPDGRAMVAISDTGAGIDEDLRGRIFEPFFTTKPLGQGTGLGLSISHGIVRSLGGEIALESEPGRGTTFTVYLPPAHAAREPGNGGAPGHRRPVLVIEPDPEVARSVGEALAADHDVVVAANANRALELVLAGRKFDSVVVDLEQAGVSGHDLYARLRAAQPRLSQRIVFLSARPLTDEERALLGHTHARHLTRPPAADSLRAALAALPA